MSTTPESALEDIAGLSGALDASQPIVDAIGDEQWSARTCCSEWGVRELLNHLVGGHLLFTAVLTNQAPPDEKADHLRDDPAGAHHDASVKLRAAFAQPGAMSKTVTVPFGTVPAAIALHLRTTETLVHAWDLAQATGQPVDGLPADVAEEEIAFCHRTLDAIPPGQNPFAPPQPVADDASAIDRLAAFLGRTPGPSGGAW